LKRQFELSSNFISGIICYSGGYISAEEMERFFNLLEAELKNYYFTESAENNLLRIIGSFFDKSSLIKDSAKYPHYIELLLSASVNSNYISDILVRDPEYFYWISNPSNLNMKLKQDEYFALVSGLTGRYKTFEGKLNALKSLKRKEILRTGMQDLLGISSLTDTTAQLSYLASAILNEIFATCYQEVQSRYKVRFTNSYCLIALGKLGGGELNYSSDTDLMLFYDQDKKYGSRYYSELLTETTKLFIESSSKMTETGYLYRIDFRLRPDGKNSSLCRSLQEYLSYYESRGEPWERQMLIKADYIGGDMELYNRFRGYLDHFVYPSSRLSPPAEQASRLKSSIEKNLKDDLNIKLTKGGIRDIEFAVQILQLLNGGSNKTLRQQNTLKALNALAEAGLITADEKELLDKAYVLYRRIEHYLQLMNDRQVHTIPEAGEVVDKMAQFISSSRREEFLEYLNELRRRVRDIYLSFVPGEKEDDIPVGIFRNPAQAEKDLEYLRRGKDITATRSFDRKTQKSFTLLEPLLHRLLKELPDADIALRNFTFFIQNSPTPSIWYNEFADETFLKYFLQICTYSNRAVALLSREPELHDFLLSRRVFAEYDTGILMEFSINKLLFYLSVSYTLHQIDSLKFSEILTSYCINKIAEIAENIPGKENYFIAGLGSLGAGEMNYSSDLDLIFIVKKTSDIKERQFRKLLSDINKELKYFKADCRLRPEGEGSQLVWALEAYTAYIKNRARVWELQALSKIRFISGSEKMFDAFIHEVINRIETEECPAMKKVIYDMKGKITGSAINLFSKNFHLKKSPGGITDIEFIIQFLILCNTEFYINCRGKNLPDMVDIITRSSEKYSELVVLKESYTFLSDTGIFIQSAFDTDKFYFPDDENARKLTAAFSGISGEELKSRFNSYIKTNKMLLEKYLK
jgi:[glutamine synthetase] adenylyltransferase / [glutamine synthetase]-adenylyl-L-tyrosine phosphorylase